MSKKALLPLEELVKMVPHIILLFVVLFILIQAYLIFAAEKETQPQVDLKRIVAEIEDLEKGQSIDVPILGERYEIQTIENDARDPECRRQCLCVIETKKTCRAVAKPIAATSFNLISQKTLTLSYDNQEIKIS